MYAEKSRKIVEACKTVCWTIFLLPPAIIYDKRLSLLFLPSCACLLQKQGEENAREQKICIRIFYARGICRAGGNISRQNSKAATKQICCGAHFLLAFVSDHMRLINGMFSSLFIALLFERNDKQGESRSSNKWAISVNIKRCANSDFRWVPIRITDKSTLTLCSCWDSITATVSILPGL